MQRALALLLSVSFANLLWAKPVTVRPDSELRDCAWAAEAQVLGVYGASIRVRITQDPIFIYRGFHLIDRTVDVQPSAFGPRTCLLAMKEHARTR